ncbi:MAG: serpin family protein [Synergistaceae bacterium]|jgi:serpin B|nr:serpin family protein [Synergistaceae bacterium]
MKIQNSANYILNLTVILLLIPAVLAVILVRPAHGSAGENSAALAVNSLAVDLYGKLTASGDARQNLCFSPYSVSAALAMTYAGAASDTAGEMKKVLRFTDGIHVSGEALREELLSAPGGVELLIANSIWSQRGYRFLRSFTRLLESSYDAELLPVDFQKQPEHSRVTINDWVAERTKGKITDILPPNSVGPDSRLVLVNALYFKAAWADEFQKAATSEKEFFISGSERVMTPMMHSIRSAEYFETDTLQAVRLPYAGGAFSMLLILPREKDGLAAIEGNLDAGMIEAFRSKPERKRVDLSIPKFKAESTFDLVQALEALGVRSAFDERAADFSLMNGKGDLYINAVAHKAFVEADESGTEASAATAVGMARMSAAYAPEEPAVVFLADHPFLFMIEDNRSGTILFMGRIARP